MAKYDDYDVDYTPGRFGMMKRIDHSECDPVDCLHRREQDKEAHRSFAEQERQQAKENELEHTLQKQQAAEERHLAQAETAYYGESRRKHASEFRHSVEERAKVVESLEMQLLEAREHQASHGDPMELQSLRNVVGDALRLAHHKERAYRGAWRRQGYMGNLGRILSKAARLEEMAWKDQDYVEEMAEVVDNDETIRDTLLDLINLAGFMAVNYTEGNRWGQP